MTSVTFVQAYPDVRSDKIARGLDRLGVPVRRFHIDLDATFRPTISAGNFETEFRLPDLLRRHYYLSVISGLGPWALRRIIRSLPGDLIRTATPDFLGVEAARASKRVIAEVYDSYSLYDFPNTMANRIARRAGLRAERRLHEEADLLVYTTEEMLEYARGLYSLPRALVVPNAVLTADLPRDRLPKKSEDGRSHCVYVGLVQPAAEQGTRSILPALKEVAEEHVVHVYGVARRDQEAQVKRELQGIAEWHDPLPQDRLLRELTQYDFGLILLPEAGSRRFHTVLPAKLFEYVGAGLPVLVSPYRAMERFVKRFACGAVLGETIPRGPIPLRPEYVLDTYLDAYAREIRGFTA